MDSSVATVCRAIDAFYSGGPDVQQAQQFLQAFQESTESWTICDQIIRIHSNSLACYFASQTLRTKILKKFSQLPADQYEPLRHSLLHHLDRHGASAHDAQSEATATQLCLAIADLYIQVPTWNNWIFELLNQCQTLEGDRTVMTLTLLQVFPEEVENLRGIGENRRTAIRLELATCEQPMFSFLSHVLQKFHTNADVLRRVLKCIESNLQNPQMRTDSLAASPLLSSIFQLVSTIDSSIPSTLHENATNVVIAALFRAEEIEDHRRLAEVLHRGVIGLVDAFREAERQEDMDRLQNIARIFVETVESFYVQIVTSADPDPNAVGSLACFELLLLVAAHHDWTLVEMSFNVWYRITEELFKYDDDQYIARFRPYAEKFIVALYEHCKLDADDVDDIPDDTSEFGDFRAKAIEALRDVVFIVNSDRCIQMMHDKLLECVQKANGGWEESESALFVMAAVVQNLLPESESRMPEVLQMICSLQLRSPPALISTCLTLICDLNEWFEEHESLLAPIIPWIMQFATDPRFACQVAACFDRISVKCPKPLIPLLPQLLTLINVLELTTTHGHKVEEAICSLTRAISTIISKLPPTDSKLAMERLCEPIITNMLKLQTTESNESTAAAAANNNNGGGSNKENEGGQRSRSLESWASLATRPILWIDRCACVFKDVWTAPKSANETRDILWFQVAERFVDALMKATRKFEGTPRVIEHAIRSVRLIFRALGPQSMPLVEPVVTMMIETYPKHRHSSYLYLASVIVDEYGGLDQMRPGFIRMLDTLVPVTFDSLARGGVINHPDTIDDLFRLAQRFVSRATSAFFTDPVSQIMFVFAVENLRLDHIEASKSISKFIAEVCQQVMSARKANYSDNGVIAATAILRAQSPAIVANALWMSLFSVSGQIRRDMADLLLIVNRLEPQSFKSWLTMATTTLPNDPVKATPEQLVSFVNSVCTDIYRKERYQVFNHTRDLAKLFI